MDYPYVEIQRGFFAPVIPLEIQSSDRWISTAAFVDTGATFSIFRYELSQILGLTDRAGKRTFVTVGDGDRLEIVLHKVVVRLGERTFPAAMGFSKRLGVGFNLMGRVDFFSQFRFCFDDKHRRLSLTGL